MVSSQQEISDNYKKHFDPHKFREFKLQLFETDKWKDTMDFYFCSLGQFFRKKKFSGDRLLDLASGPCVHNVATAASYFRNIILSDFVDGNREELEKWLRKDPDKMDWSIYNPMIAKAEMRDDLDDTEIGDRIRSAVKAVVYCDLLRDGIIPEEYRRQPFDLILSVLTLENSVADLDTYSMCLGRIYSLLKKGGILIMMGLLKCSSYTVGGQTFHYLCVEKSDIHVALEKNGFGHIKWSIKEQINDGLPPFSEKAYFVTSTKI